MSMISVAACQTPVIWLTFANAQLLESVFEQWITMGIYTIHNQ